MPDTETRPTGPLRPIELATASVLAGLAVVLTVVGWFLPHLSVVAAFAVVPLGVVAHRHRLRALLASTFAAAVISFLVGGPGTVTNIVECAAVGGLVGVVKRRGWSGAVVVAGAAVIGPVLAAVSDGLLLLFAGIRKLTLKQIHNTWVGVRRVGAGVAQAGVTLLHDLGRLVGSAVRLHVGVVLPPRPVTFTSLDPAVAAALRDWWLSIAVIVIVATFWFALLGWVFLGAVLDRLQWIQAADRLDVVSGTDVPGPVPAHVEDVSYRYPGADADALRHVSLDLGAAEMVALVGDNGSGKSTLARLLAGRPPSSGRVVRPGPAGLGRPGGTAMIMQHPDSQVLGVRAADDVVWGLADPAGVDVDGLLGTVGLTGMADRETSTLSGGELQRLAVAAALARRPGLLISDESTAMVDEEGRELLTGLLRRLPEERGVSVVHVTHRPEEAAVADRRYRLAGGRLVGDEEAVTALPPDRRVGDGMDLVAEPLELVGIGHSYAAGSPWAQVALRGIDLRVEPTEGVLVLGGNGSGKSTLAWIMAGLLRPSEGRCLLGGRPVREQVGSVGLAFQHARLQLQKATVGRDLRAAGAADDDAAAVALAAVGLDYGKLKDRRIDALSGGQQRRVAIAGLLARHPSVLVLDEPLAGLDRPGRDVLVGLLAALRREQGLTVVVISHDIAGMELVCDRTVRLERGRVVADSDRARAAC